MVLVCLSTVVLLCRLAPQLQRGNRETGNGIPVFLFFYSMQGDAHFYGLNILDNT